MIAAACAAGLAAAMLVAPAPAPAAKADPYPCRDRIVRILHDAGFRGESLTIAWAIVMRESHGRNLDESSPWYSGALGIWQIQTSAHAGKPWHSREAMLDPDTQSRIAFRHMTNRGTWWQPWGLTSPRADGIDATAYGSWSSATQYALIWAPFAKYRAAFPNRCRS